MPLETTARSPLVQQAIDQLRNQISAGEWPIGERIPPETELATLLGVGRNTLREAVKALSHAGLLECRQGSGTYVLTTSELSSAIVRRAADAELRDIIEVRRGFEIEAARLAAHRRTATDLERLDATLELREQAWESGDVTHFIEADTAFHTAIVAAAHNQLLADLYADFSTALLASMQRIVGNQLAPEHHLDHHRLVIAIRARDEAAAIAEINAFSNETAAGVTPAAVSNDHTGPRSAS